MTYLLKGNLRGLLCSDCELPVLGTVKLYKPADNANVATLAAADPKQTFHQLSDDELKAQANLLIAEGPLQENGDFAIQIDDKSGYSGGALDVDWYCGTPPVVIGPGPKKDLTLQFHITTFQPAWTGGRENIQSAVFDYKIDPKWFCRILTLFDIWVVCGIVTDCQTQKPVAGVKVFAYDVDLIQDDFLGSNFTDASGKFTIVYPGANFRQTIFSPLLNIEWPAGPDYYFRIESSSGAVLLQEDRTRGRQADRHNANNCFCVRLCLTGDIITSDFPWFTAVGYFSITSDIDSAGLTQIAKFGAGGTGYGFFGDVKLEGFATKKVPTAPSSPLFYRFQYSFDGVNFNPVTKPQMGTTALKVATRQITWNGTTAFQDVVIDFAQAASTPDSIPPDNFPNPIPDHVILPDANGWIRVDQPALDGGFYGPLAYLDTNSIVPGGDASGGLTPGNPVSVADQKNGRLVYIQFQTTDDPSNPASPNLNTQVLLGKIFVNNWNTVSLLKLEELFAGGGTGCTPIQTQAHVDYTVDHEMISSWSIGIRSNATGDIAGLPSGTTPRGQAAILNLATAALTPAFSTWPSCAYMLYTDSVRKLTTGELNDSTQRFPLILFCK